MRRFIILLWSGIAMTGSSTAESVNTTIITRSVNGNSHAEIIQTGPKDDEPVVQTRRGPGYVIIEQRSKNNRAVIMQGN
jgi:hypothetical protein